MEYIKNIRPSVDPGHLRSIARELIFKPNGQIRNRCALHPESYGTADLIEEKLSASVGNARKLGFQYCFTVNEEGATYKRLLNGRRQGKKYSFFNVLGKLENRPIDILVTAHYDSSANREDDWNHEDAYPTQGADDNASGVSAMLALAEILGKQGSKGYNVGFLATAGEELQQLGARHFLYQEPLNAVKCIFILDMIGFNRANEGVCSVYSSNAMITGQRMISMKKYLLLFNLTSWSMPRFHTTHTDFDIFQGNGIPSILLSEKDMDHNLPILDSSRVDYHTKDDTIDNLDFRQIANIVELLAMTIEDISRKPSKA